MNSVRVTKTNLNDILPLRDLFLQENSFQIRYNACHERGWSDSYLVVYNNEKIGYGSIRGNKNPNDRDTVFEFFIISPSRNLSNAAFSELLRISNAKFIECQSNDLLLTAMLYQFGENINSDVVLFEDKFSSDLKVGNFAFRRREENELVFEHKSEPVGDFVLEQEGEILATGGFLLHYNMPYADLFMEVKEAYRRKGLGSFLIQELKKQCYLAGRVPAARCNMENVASKATLEKAGFKIAGFMLLGQVKSIK